MLFGQRHPAGFLWHICVAPGLGLWASSTVRGGGRGGAGGCWGQDPQSSPDPGTKDGGAVEAAGPSAGATEPGHPSATLAGTERDLGSPDIAKALRQSKAAQPRARLLLRAHGRKFSRLAGQKNSIFVFYNMRNPRPTLARLFVNFGGKHAVKLSLRLFRTPILKTTPPKHPHCWLHVAGLSGTLLPPRPCASAPPG